MPQIPLFSLPSHPTDQGGLKLLQRFPAPASQGLGFKAFATTPLPTTPLPTTPQLALWSSIVPIQESGTQPESVANGVDYISGTEEKVVLLLQYLGLSLGFQQEQTQWGNRLKTI